MNKTVHLEQIVISFLCVALFAFAFLPVAFADHGDEAEVETHATSVHDDEDDHAVTTTAHTHDADAEKLETIVSLLAQVKVLIEKKQALMDGHTHSDATDDHDHTEMVESDATAKLSVTKGMMGNYDLHLETTNFTFAPEHADKAHVDEEGHAHVFIDGVKAGRMYSPWMYVPALSKGTHTIKVSLATNDHKAYAHDGKAIEASATVEVK